MRGCGASGVQGLRLKVRPLLVVLGLEGFRGFLGL